MLWIETHKDDLINMDHVTQISMGYFELTTDAHEGLWVTLQLANQPGIIKVAKGETQKHCKSMIYRIMTYIENNNDYGDRNIIRHKWLTHKLP